MQLIEVAVAACVILQTLLLIQWVCVFTIQLVWARGDTSGNNLLKLCRVFLSVQTAHHCVFYLFIYFFKPLLGSSLCAPTVFARAVPAAAQSIFYRPTVQILSLNASGRVRSRVASRITEGKGSVLMLSFADARSEDENNMWIQIQMCQSVFITLLIFLLHTGLGALIVIDYFPHWAELTLN